jgi:hypothetical protein
LVNTYKYDDIHTPRLGGTVCIWIAQGEHPHPQIHSLS